MITKRYHLKDEIAAKTGQYWDKCLELERYLQLSITPKSHIIEDHSCKQQVYFKGIEEEKIKANEEAQINHPKVQDRVQDIKKKGKRKYEVTRSGVQETAAEEQQRREEARAEALNL
jgi:hypothetical protein